MKDRSDDPSHHERTLLPQSYISLPYIHHPIDRIAHTTAFVTAVVEHWLEREIAQWVHPMRDRSDDLSHHERTLLPQSYISLPYIHHPIDRIANTTAFVTAVVEHWLEREMAQWVHPMKDRSDDPSHHERTLLPRSDRRKLLHQHT